MHFYMHLPCTYDWYLRDFVFKRYCSLYLAVAATLNVNPAVVTVENNFVLERPPHSEEEEEDTDELDGDIEDGHCLESEGISISIVLLKFTQAEKFYQS